MSNLSILGSGGFGCSFGIMCYKNGHDVSIWSYSDHEASEINKYRENKQFLPNVKIPDAIKITSDIDEVTSAEVIILSVPSFAVRNVIKLLHGKIEPSQIIVCACKGLEESSLKLFSDVIEEELPNNKCVILSGPSHAEELTKDSTITAVISSSKDAEASNFIQQTLSNKKFKIYINNDIVGVQIGAAFKNIIALAAGICEGMKLGDNTKAALVTRGLGEIATLGMSLNAKRETFNGLSGIGDLIVTCTSLHSRNMRTGILIGQGLSVKKAIEKTGMVVEGYIATKCAYLLAKNKNLDIPIINQMYEILYNDKKVADAIQDLLSLPNKGEF